MGYKKIRVFNGKEYSLHKECGTMIDVLDVKEELKRQGFNVRVTSRGIWQGGANVYKRMKA